MNALVISDHARWQAGRRGIDEETIRKVARAPEQVVAVRQGREVRQSRIRFGTSGKLYLVRVIVDTSREEATVVTVHRTSDPQRYWRDA